ncbi:hypothetical protein HK105_200803 [Polyrhizophydium stewartii]|uniref:Uncharacterized protein n=1 Tax=Polyrhizophydium stewartii TaxID=2732419 RepID=A0ABR4NK52_9FUNG
MPLPPRTAPARPTRAQLCLSTFNAAKSAFVIISVHRAFFESFSYAPAHLCYRLLLKPLSNIFKTSSNTDTIEQCRIRPVYEAGEERLVVQLTCKYGVLKTHRLNYEACEPMQAVFSREDCPHSWIASPRMIQDQLAHFQLKLKEVTLSCKMKSFQIKSFEDSFVPDGTTVVRSLETEVTIDLEDFEQYSVFGDADLTFELKDFKAVLAFAEAVDLHVTALFDQAGGGQEMTASLSLNSSSPLLFSCAPSPTHFQADFVLAVTLNAGGKQTSPTQARQHSAQPSQALSQATQRTAFGVHVQHRTSGPQHSHPFVHSNGHTQHRRPSAYATGDAHMHEMSQMAAASGTVVMPSQGAFQPIPGLHHDHVEVLVPQSPTNSSRDEFDARHRRSGGTAGDSMSADDMDGDPTSPLRDHAGYRRSFNADRQQRHARSRLYSLVEDSSAMAIPHSVPPLDSEFMDMMADDGGGPRSRMGMGISDSGSDPLGLKKQRHQ